MMKTSLFKSVIWVIVAYSCVTTKPSELTYKTYYPVLSEGQSLNYVKERRFVENQTPNAYSSVALNYTNSNKELFITLFVQNFSDTQVTVDYPMIKITGDEGNPIAYYTGYEFLNAKADRIVGTQMSNQAYAAFVNNELNKNNLHVANDYITDSYSNRQSYGSQMDYYNQYIFRPETLSKKEYVAGMIFLKEHDQVINVALEIGREVHRFQFELK